MIIFNLEYITEEELLEYESNNDETVIWEKQEEILINLHKINLSKVKLQIWVFMFDYEENYETITSAILSLKMACSEISNNIHLKKLISYILSIGNILNSSTVKGQADGFSLDVLSKISSIKDKNQKTLTQYICLKLKKEDETFENFKKSFLNVFEAAKISYQENNSNLNKLKKEVKDQISNLNKLSQNLDIFYEKAQTFLNKCLDQTSKLDLDLNLQISKFQELALFLGYQEKDEKYKNPEKLFELFVEFINDVDRSIPKDEPKKVFNRKHEVGKKIIENVKNPQFDSIFQEMKLKMK